MELRTHTYIEHALNHSPSKTSYTFSKSERFKEKSPKKYMMNSSNNLHKEIPRSKSRKQVPRSKSPNQRRLEIREENYRENSPRGYYNRPPGASSPITKKSIGKYKNYKHKYANQEQRALMNNNKAYRNHDNTSPMHAKLGGWPESKQWFSKSKSKSPQKSKSPSRQVPESQKYKVNAKPGRSKSKSPNRYAPRRQQQVYIQRNNSMEYEDYQGSKLGPGSYNIQPSKVGEYVESKFKNNKGMSFGKGVRLENEGSHGYDRKITRGPGSYNIFSEFGN